MELTGKHVLVTGAAGTVGSAVADRALELGARLTLVDRHAPAGVTEERWIAVDLTDAAAVEAALRSLPPVDAFFHIAGGFDMGPPVYASPPTLFDAMVSINVATLQTMIAVLAPLMMARGQGAIVTVGALSALKGQAGMGAYCAAKSVVMRLTESLSAETKDFGVNVNCVLPSIVDSLANRRDMPDADFTRWVTPRELAQVICFLGSSGATAMHGAMIPIAGRV